MYMPLLMIVILFAVQFCLIYLGGQVASGAAREAARVARVTGDGGAASARAYNMIDNIGDGVLDTPHVDVTISDVRARVTVSGKASEILPWLPFPRVTETVEGPRERFVPDDGTGP
jgi:Flp pilus assembly protein TadG